MPTWGTVLSPEQLDDLVALIAAWRKGAQVAPSFSADELLERAAFALEQGDAESGLLQLGRASEIASGVGAEALANVISQVRSGDLEGAEKTLDLLRERWPMGDPSEGVTAYSASCAPCHGIQGEGGVGPPLQDNAFILSQNNAVLVQFLREGRPGTAMAGFDERLTENQLANITSFLRLWQSSP
jgi:mono/diheme cytochrome c family protein